MRGRRAVFQIEDESQLCHCKFETQRGKDPKALVPVQKSEVVLSVLEVNRTVATVLFKHYCPFGKYEAVISDPGSAFHINSGTTT